MTRIGATVRGRSPCSARVGRASEIVFTIHDAPEGGFEARALGHSIFTEADSMDELREMISDAVRCHFAASSRPSMIRLHHVRDEVISV